ncbi:unnamed protein product [Camellia sinensis]
MALLFGGADSLPFFLARQHLHGLDIVVDPCAALLVIVITGLLCAGIKEVIEERKNHLLDGVDNSEWLDLVSDDDDGGGGGGGGDGNGDDSDGNDGGGTHRYQARRTSLSLTPTPTQSDNSGCLTSSDGGGDDGDSGGTSHGDRDGDGGGGGDNGGDGSSFGAGSEDFIGGFGLCDVGEHYDIGEPVAPLPKLLRRFCGSDTRRDERRIRSREQQRDSSDSSQCVFWDQENQSACEYEVFFT